MRAVLLRVSLAVVALVTTTLTGSAQSDFTALQTGNWGTIGTWTGATIPQAGDNAIIGSTVTGGAAMPMVTLDGFYNGNPVTSYGIANLTLGQGAGTMGTLALGNYTLNATGSLVVGGSGNGVGKITRGTGSFTTKSLSVNNVGSTLTFTNGDSVSQSVAITNGGGLNLGKALTVSGGTITVDGAASRINAANFAITATTITLNGGTQNGQTLLQNAGVITADTLTTTNVDLGNLVSGSNVRIYKLTGGSGVLASGAVVQQLLLDGSASVTLQGSGNIGQILSILGGSNVSLGTNLVALGADATVTGSGSKLNAAGNNVSLGSLTIGSTGSASQLVNPGLVSVSNALTIGGTSVVSLLNNGDSVGSIVLNDTAKLTANGRTGQTQGVTITNSSSSALAIANGAQLVVNLDRTSPGYALRWANPAGGDHIADLQALINDPNNKIAFNVVTPNSAYLLESVGGYTLITVPVPEPTLLLAAGLVPLAFPRLRRALRRV
jgi:hypothetical protein